jgi:NADH-quinone oxidoreductase subunit C
VGENTTYLQPQLFIAPTSILNVCQLFFKNPQCYFDSLSNLSVIDNGPQKGTMDVIYHLYSIPFNHHLVLKCEISRADLKIASVTSVWRTADWMEREAYDFFGVIFEAHPDLRRILLPADWEGFPMRKDYEEQETYRGIKVRY